MNQGIKVLLGNIRQTSQRCAIIAAGVFLTGVFVTTREKTSETQAYAVDGRIDDIAVKKNILSELPVATKAGEEWSGGSLRMKFCWCPPGKFVMGSPENEPTRYDDENQADVTFSTGFWLGKYEVTQGQWKRVIGTTVEEIFERTDKLDLDGWAWGKGDDFPMYFINQDNIVEFCRKLTEKDRAAGLLPAGCTYRLPTEAQWEYACRAGTTTATAFGDSLSSEQANIDGNYPYNGAREGPNKESTTRVGSYHANAWGFCDMHGNVYEWCDDWYAKRLPGGNDPCVTARGMSQRVVRGGCFKNAGECCRSAFRTRAAPGSLSNSRGFRVAIVHLIK